MSKGMNWNRAKAPKPTEDAIGGGFVRNDGRITKGAPQDSLAKRAARAEAVWMRRNGMKFDRSGRIVPGR